MNALIYMDKMRSGKKLMRPVEEIQRVNERVVFWQGYAPAARLIFPRMHI